MNILQRLNRKIRWHLKMHELCYKTGTFEIETAQYPNCTYPLDSQLFEWIWHLVARPISRNRFVDAINEHLSACTMCTPYNRHQPKAQHRHHSIMLWRKPWNLIGVPWCFALSKIVDSRSIKCVDDSILATTANFAPEHGLSQTI